MTDKQDELLLTPQEIQAVVDRAWTKGSSPTATDWCEAQLAKVLKHREEEPMIVASSGALHPESDFELEYKKHRLDRPDREEIAKKIFQQTWYVPDDKIDAEWKFQEPKEPWYKRADQILVLYPDESKVFVEGYEMGLRDADQDNKETKEQIRKKIEAEFALKFNPDYLDFKQGVEEGRKLERERIINLLQGLLEMSAQNEEPTIKVRMMEVLQALKEEK